MSSPDGPKYATIADDLRREIEAGALPPGALLPSTRDLVQRYGVTAMTVRQAIDVLVSEGLIVVTHGAGVRVREYRRVRSDRVRRLEPSQWGNGLAVWGADTAGRDLRVEDVRVERVVPPGHVAALLGLEDGEEAVRRSRTFVVDGKPVQIASNWLPATLAAGTPIEQQDTGPGGTYARLAELGHAPVGFTEEVVARMPSHTQAATLQMLPGTPILEVRRTARDASGRPVEAAEMLIDASAFELVYTWMSTQRP